MNMITEDYVSFETAKLLKEKGFDEDCRAFYKEWDGEVILYPCAPSHLFEYCCNSMLEKFNDSEETNTAAPTLQMAMKWLREVHNIHISVYVFNRDLPVADKALYTCDIATKEQSSKDGHLRLVSDTYEEACEIAIDYVLKMEIKNDNVQRT